jgi:ATP-binding cassette, subfamily B, bacterial PglK
MVAGLVHGEQENRGIREAFRTIFEVMSPRRRRQLVLALSLMVAGAIAELLTIGAVLPLLALLAAPEMVHDMPMFTGAVRLVGLDPSEDLLLPATVFLVLVAITTASTRLALVWVSQSFIFRLGHDLATALYGRVLRQPYGDFIRRNSSEILAGVEKVHAVIFNILLPLMQGFIAAVIAVCIVTLMFFIDAYIAAVAAAALGSVYVIVTLVSRRRLSAASTIMADRTTRRIKQLQEGVGGIRDILLDQSQEPFEEQFRRVDRELRDAQTVYVFIGTAPRYIVESAGVALIAGLAYYMSFQPGGLIAAIPVLGALAIAAQRLLPLLQMAYNGWAMFAGNRDSLIDVATLLQAPVLLLPQRRVDNPLPFRQRIALRNLSFNYAPDAPALRNLNLVITKGARVGFIGRTGSGKSTLADIIMGLLEPTAGAIEIDGVPLSQDNMANWQAQIAHVPQAIYLADRSIAANIAFGVADRDIDGERVRQAARQARIHDFIEGLPQGYETQAGERGVRLSGGQRQRIGIARALYKRASVMIFDEATSALDNETETAVMQAVSELDRDLTVLMIAHRLTTVAACDTVVRLEAGRIIDEGPFDRVVQDAAERKTS